MLPSTPTPKTLDTWQKETNAALVVNGGYFSITNERYFPVGSPLSTEKSLGAVLMGSEGCWRSRSPGRIKDGWSRNPTMPMNRCMRRCSRFPSLCNRAANSASLLRGKIRPEPDEPLLRRIERAHPFYHCSSRIFYLAPVKRLFDRSDLNLEIALNLDGGGSTGILVANPRELFPPGRCCHSSFWSMPDNLTNQFGAAILIFPLTRWIYSSPIIFKNASTTCGSKCVRISPEYDGELYPSARFPVRAIGSQGVIYVHDAEDACAQRDLFPFSPRGIRAIPFFVMAVGDIQCMAKIGDGFEHLKRIDGMHAHAAHSSSVNWSGLSRMRSGMPILPMSWRSAPWRIWINACAAHVHSFC